jgi:selenide,water dikinase
MATNATPVRLTSLAHGGGCGCKLAPAVLEQLLAGQAPAAAFSNLVVGTETGDDAAVWRLEGDTCVVATTDFFTPIVDDAADFGRIAATNAISDVYAMGARPLFALAILGMPLGRVGPDTVRQILAGGAEVCARAGIPVAGGHSIDAPEPIYGLAVIGSCKAHEVRRNSEAQPGDALVLTKALGVGVYSAAIKNDALDADGYAELLATTTLLNSVGAALGRDAAVHAMTDVTGFGLLGHALEMARGSRLKLVLDAPAIPLLSRAAELARAGVVTGASQRNWASYGARVGLPAGLADWQRHLFTDPQTSGGLLVSVAAPRATAVLGGIRAAGFASARIIGRTEAGEPGITVVGALD